MILTTFIPGLDSLMYDICLQILMDKNGDREREDGCGNCWIIFF